MNYNRIPISIILFTFFPVPQLIYETSMLKKEHNKH